MGAGTGDVRAVEFTSSSKGDSSLPPELLAQIPPDESTVSVAAPSRQIALQSPAGQWMAPKTHDGVMVRSPIEVPPGSYPSAAAGAPGKRTAPVTIARNENLRATRHLGRALWRKWSQYHTRSRVEARMNCLKPFGERIMSRNLDRQTAEIQPCIAIMNRFNALGTAEIEAVA